MLSGDRRWWMLLFHDDCFAGIGDTGHRDLIWPSKSVSTKPTVFEEIEEQPKVEKIGHYIVDCLDVSTMEIVGREGPIKRIFNEKTCVIESLIEREFGKKTEETSYVSQEILKNGLGDDIDDRIMKVCLEINRRRQLSIESEDKEEAVDLEKVVKENNSNLNVNKFDDRTNVDKSLVEEVDFSCPSFGLGFTQEEAEKKGCNNQKPQGDSQDKFPGFVFGLLEAESQEGRHILGDKDCLDKQGNNLKPGSVNDEFLTFSLGLTQQGNQEDCSKFSDTAGRENSEKMNVPDMTQKMSASGCKLVDRRKAEILAGKYNAIAEIEATKDVPKNSNNLESLNETSDKPADKSCCESADGNNIIQVFI
ncbi:hypothetical protein E3N88_14194 [Mikania micrantha]|uniref:Uncharacterized protein n=1 Tax=Mikania micrantha TaxID=192012 RepID=A0A5N6P0R9_9ASTR|nr:hypothetical protein E3N88_14194 [Mikania micrantha]